jgi:coenzyme PQQ precursor peptide PqqA
MGGSVPAHENHEIPFMIACYVPGRHARMIDSARHRSSPLYRRHVMKWETPEAIDMRFGMEITMYISNR